MDWGSLIGSGVSAIGNLFHHPNSTPPEDQPTDNPDGSPAQSGVGGFMSGLLKGISSPGGQAALGRGLGSVAQAQAQNRGAKIAAMMGADQMKMAEQAQRNNDLAGLPRQIVGANYLAGGGQTPRQNFSASGRAIPQFDLGTPKITAADQAAGSSLSQQLTNRLNNAPTYNDYSSSMNPSKTETALNWISPILAAGGAGQQAEQDPYIQMLQKLVTGMKTQQQPQAPTTPIPSAGDAMVSNAAIPLRLSPNFLASPQSGQ